MYDANAIDSINKTNKIPDNKFNQMNFSKYFKEKLTEESKDYSQIKIEQINNYLDEILYIEEKNFDDILTNYILQTKILYEEEIENNRKYEMLLKILQENK